MTEFAEKTVPASMSPDEFRQFIVESFREYDREKTKNDSTVEPVRSPVPPMPPEIAKAVVAVMRDVQEPQKDGTNNFSNYNYATVDAFLAAMRPVCAKAGLVIYPVEAGQTWEEVIIKDGAIRVSTFTFEFILIHESGVQWQHPYDKRILRLQWAGAQTSGIAKSYAQKQYMRSLFQIATGDPDADSLEMLDDEGQRRSRKKSPAEVVQGAQPGTQKAPPPLVKRTSDSVEIKVTS